MFTLEAFEHWAVGEKDHKGEIITEQRINNAHKELFEKHPKDLPMVTRKMVMGLFKMELLDFEKKHFPVIHAASVEIKRLENLPMSTTRKVAKFKATHLDAELCEYKEICLHKTKDNLVLALYKRNRISAESYANFCVEYFDTSVGKPAPPAKPFITPKQDPVPRKLLPSQKIIQHTPTSPPPSYTSGLHDSPTVLKTIGMPVVEPSFTAELEAASVKEKPVLLPPPTKTVTKIKASVGDTKFDAELREYTQLCLKSKGDLAYALYLRGRFSEEEYTKFCAEYREGDVPK